MTDGICPFAEQITGVRTYSPGMLDRVGFCDHTAGGYYSTLRRADFWNNAGVSTHFGISLEGDICQMVNIFDTAYAQGRLGPTVQWPPYSQMNRENPNLYLISTEHEDHQVTNLHWPPAMYEADLKLKRWCIQEVKRVAKLDMMRFGIDSLAGHVMFDQVNRSYCPGKWWETDGRFQLFNDLVTPQIVEGEEMVFHVTISADERGDKPFRSYLISGSVQTGFTSRWLTSGEEFDAAQIISSLREIPLSTLMTFNPNPSPLAD